MSGRVVVVGGGVSGLATAYRLVSGSKDVDVVVLEAGPEPGGKVRSARVGDLQLDAGPDSLIARKPWAVQLARDLGLARELVAPSTGVTFVWTDEGLRRFPGGPFGIPIAAVPGRRVASPVHRLNRHTPLAAGLADWTAP